MPTSTEAPVRRPVVLDTDVVSQAHKGRLPDPLATLLVGRQPLITFVTVGELIKWAEVRAWGHTVGAS